jgi:hypothetical protein
MAAKLGSLPFTEEHRLSVFEYRVLRRIFGPRRDEVTGDWTKLHNEELHNLYSSPNIIRMNKLRRMRWAGYSRHGCLCVCTFIICFVLSYVGRHLAMS